MNTDTLALFDLDNTLLPIDSDYEWGQFLVKLGVVDPIAYEKQNKIFFTQYKNGVLDPEEFLCFTLGTMSQFSRKQLDNWRNQYMQEIILPAITPQAKNLLKKHRDQHDLIAIVTATNRFVTEPIANAFGVENLIAAIPEETPEGEITGKIIGTPTSGAGKIEHTKQWLKTLGLSFENFKDVYFYSDSDSDLPLLTKVNHPVAVNPNDKLKAIAKKNGWPLLQLFE